MTNEEQKTMVYIVGTGPGDPGLLTLKADSLIRSADIVLYDCRAVEPLLHLASAGAKVVAVERNLYEDGKGDREHTPMVEAIREHYGEGKKVVRLKAGDPSLFGGEVDECDVLGRIGIPYSIVPGVSSGAAAACAYALPISRKFESDAVVNIIANEITDDFALFRDAAGLLRHGATMVLYMATDNLPGLLGIFREEGIPDETPVVAVSKAGRIDEAFLETTLGDMGADGFSLELKDPVVYTVGRYVRVRNLPEPEQSRSALFLKCPQ